MECGCCAAERESGKSDGWMNMKITDNTIHRQMKDEPVGNEMTK